MTSAGCLSGDRAARCHEGGDGGTRPGGGRDDLANYVVGRLARAENGCRTRWVAATGDVMMLAIHHPPAWRKHRDQTSLVPHCIRVPGSLHRPCVFHRGCPRFDAVADRLRGAGLAAVAGSAPGRYLRGNRVAAILARGRPKTAVESLRYRPRLLVPDRCRGQGLHHGRPG